MIERGLLILAALCLIKFGFEVAPQLRVTGKLQSFLDSNQQSDRVAIAADFQARTATMPSLEAASFDSPELQGLSSSNSSLANSAVTINTPIKGKNELSEKVASLAGIQQVDWSERQKDIYHSALAKSNDADRKNAILAVLEIPELSIKAPIYNGTEDAQLDRGVGRIKGTGWFTQDAVNVGLAAHRDSFFRGLKNASKGQRITVTTKAGSYQYQIDAINIVEPEDVSVLNKTGKSQITLVTCYPFYFVGNAPQRYIVSATLVAESV